MKHLRILRYVDEVARAGSIRKAADHLNVTASAVNRRIMDLEEELGAQLFERRPRGVRLTAAGEVFVHYLREQDGDVERMKSQIEDLKGCAAAPCASPAARRWRSISCRARSPNSASVHPLVAFDVKVLDHEQAMAALAAYEVDLVLVFRPPFLRQLPAADDARAAPRRRHVGATIRSPAARTVRLRDCAAYPVALPERSIGGRQLLDEVLARSGLQLQASRPSRIRSRCCAAWCCTPT